MEPEERPPSVAAGGASRLSVLGPADLTGPEGRPIRSGSLQPKRLVLPAYLAMTSRRAFVRRDTLLGLFWPELAGDQARHALRQALHQIRSIVGRDAIVGRGEGEVAASRRVRWCVGPATSPNTHCGRRGAARGVWRWRARR